TPTGTPAQRLLIIRSVRRNRESQRRKRKICTRSPSYPTSSPVALQNRLLLRANGSGSQSNFLRDPIRLCRHPCQFPLAGRMPFSGRFQNNPSYRDRFFSGDPFLVKISAPRLASVFHRRSPDPRLRAPAE